MLKQNNKLLFLDAKMDVLNLPDFSEKLKISPSKEKIFDPIRKKFVALTPEEWVRQNFIAYLKYTLDYPLGLMSVEYCFNLNGLSKRSDLVVFNNNGTALMVAEFKASTVAIDQKTFDQIATYNLKLNVEFLVVSNGLSHYCCRFDFENKKYHFLEEIPSFASIK